MAISERQFIEVMRLGATQAGAVARYLQGKVPTEAKKGRRTMEAEAVTAVDLATQDVLLHLLRHSFKDDIAVDAEEDTDAVHLFHAPTPGLPLVVLDPVDGTLNYTRGSREYAVMGALLIDDVFRASVIHFPEHDQMYWAIRGEGCFVQQRDEQPVRLSHPALPDRILVSPGVDHATRTALSEHAAEVQLSRCSAVDASAPAIGWARGSVADGRADRRRAIGFLLTLEAGGSVLFGDRRWNGEDPEQLNEADCPSIAAASDELAQRLRRAVG